MHGRPLWRPAVSPCFIRANRWLPFLCISIALCTVTIHAAEPSNVFDEYLRTDFRVADGFDYPCGDVDGKGSYTDRATGKAYKGWYVATHFADNYSFGIHPGEDWNGVGGGNTDLGQDVFTVANGRVVFAASCGKLFGNVVMIDHVFYENNAKRHIRSVYVHLQDMRVKEGEEVRRRQLIGHIGQDPDRYFPAHLHFEMRWDDSLPATYWPSSNQKDVAWVKEHYAEPTAFLQSHRRLFVPSEEEVLVLVDPVSYRLRLFRKGEKLAEYDVSFGQAKGQKRIEGDLKTPRGMYFVTGKKRGKFSGEYAAYFGGYWIEFNYPNPFDAAWGRAQGIINQQQKAQIAAAWEKRAVTLEKTPLGGGVGFHGWIKEWPNTGPRHLSFGCVVLHVADIGKFYEQVPEGAMVVIL
jgi:lipoprotein-anchoring transpeptidase ErfK/SrfK